jgi:hypothetical protein
MKRVGRGASPSRPADTTSTGPVSSLAEPGFLFHGYSQASFAPHTPFGTTMVGAYHSWDSMMLLCVRLERQGFQVALTKSAEDPQNFDAV